MATTKSVGGAIDAPPIAAAPFGVVNSLTLQSNADRWEGGIGFESMTCSAIVSLIDVCSATQPPINLVDGSGKERTVYAPPFGIAATDTCTSTFGSDFRDKAEGRAAQLLEAATQKSVETELKWGLMASTNTVPPVGRWLTSPFTEVVDSTGYCPSTAVAMLEDAYADCGYGGPGVLHLTRGSSYDLKLIEDGDVLRTQNGTQVILGTGYGKHPDNNPGAWDGTWAFITGPVYVWLDEIQVYPDTLESAVNIATNDIRFKAERLAAVTFDGCCAFAAKIDLAKIC